MIDVYVYVVPLPSGVHEMVVPCPDGYTVYISATDDRKRQIAAYKHALRHIQNDDHSRQSVQVIEGEMI